MVRKKKSEGAATPEVEARRVIPLPIPSEGATRAELTAYLEEALRRWEEKEAEGKESWSKSAPVPENRVVELTAWRSEQALRAYCFFTPERGYVPGPLEYASPDGKVKISVYQCRDFGIPNVWDADLLDFIISKGREMVGSEKDFPESVTFYANEALRALGKVPNSGKNHEALKLSMRRLATASIECNFINSRVKGTEIFSPLSFRLLEDVKDRKVELYQARLHPWFRESIQAGRILATEPALAKMLLSEERSGLRKMLLRIVGVRLGKQEALVFWQENLMALCQAKEPEKRFRQRVKDLDLPWAIEFRKENRRWKVIISRK